MKELLLFLQLKSRKSFNLVAFQKVTAASMGAIHVCFLFLFICSHVTIMAIANAFSVACYLVAFLLAGEKYALVHFKLLYYEVLIHLILVIIMIGDKSGFGLYCMAMVPVTYYFAYLFSLYDSTKQKKFNPLYYAVLSIVAYLFLKVYAYYREPVYCFLDYTGRMIIFTINFTLV